MEVILQDAVFQHYTESITLSDSHPLPRIGETVEWKYNPSPRVIDIIWMSKLNRVVILLK